MGGHSKTVVKTVAGLSRKVDYNEKEILLHACLDLYSAGVLDGSSRKYRNN